MSDNKGRIVPSSHVDEDPLAVCDDGDWFCRECKSCLCRKCGHEPGCAQWAAETMEGVTFVYDPYNPPSGVWEWDATSKTWNRRAA